MNPAMDAAVGDQGLYHSCCASTRPISIQLSNDVAQRILRDGIRGLALVPRRGAEIGGVLLGVVEEGPETVIRISGAVPVPCEYAFGPSYHLSENDLRNLRSVLRSWPPSSGDVRAVGFYRTHTRRQPGLSDEDREILAEGFPEAPSVVLVVKPHAIKASVAAVYFGCDGDVIAEPEYLELQLEQGARAERARSDAAPAEPCEPEPREPEPREPEPRKPKPREPKPRVENIPLPSFLCVPETRFRLPLPRWYSWWVQIPLLAALVTADAYLGSIAARTIPLLAAERGAARDPYSMSLVVFEVGENLHLNWDRASIPVASAARGVLSIADGDSRRSMPLDAAQLRAGSVIYRRVTEDIEFRLEVFIGEKTSVAESWRRSAGPLQPREPAAGESAKIPDAGGHPPAYTTR